MENVIEVKSLVKSYGKIKAISDLSFEVKKGEILGLLGPNGSGKSTTINCILSLLKFDSGKIQIFGKEMTPESYDIKAKIGVVFQDVAVFDELTVYENINYFCGLYILDKKNRKEYVDEAIELVGLVEFKKFYPKQLSGGLLRRLNIACGIAHKPELIFLDEPTVAVDPQSRNNILEGIRKLNEKGATIIYTSHYMEEVEQLCNRIVIIDKGEVVASGTKEELKGLISVKEKITIQVDELNEINDKNLQDIKANRNVDEVKKEKNCIYISYKSGENNIGELINYLSENKIKYNRIFSELPTLNDVFLELTGKELRDV
jgi:ABC-2 type transport system ATP-binding protein